MKQTKIDWCDCTVNPVVGCKNGCPYCYAQKLNDRFHFVNDWTQPQFFEDRLKQLNSKKPKSIFMNSMSDISYWLDEWIDKCLSAMENNPQHRYVFLTKAHALPYNFFFDNQFHHKDYIFYGKSVTRQSDIAFIDYVNFNFWSIEPLLEPIKVEFTNPERFSKIKQVIIGAETGNRKDKVIPQKKWVDDIVNDCDAAGIRVFMKESLHQIMGKDFRQDKLIWAVAE